VKKIQSIEVFSCDVCGQAQSLDYPEPMAKCKCGRDVCEACAMYVRVQPSGHQRCDDSDPNACKKWRDVVLCPDCGERLTAIIDAFPGELP